MRRTVTVRLTAAQASAVLDGLAVLPSGNRSVRARAAGEVRYQLRRPRRSPNRWHADLMEAWEAATAQWAAQMERETVMHRGDVTAWLVDHPAPQLGDFMRAASNKWREQAA